MIWAAATQHCQLEQQAALVAAGRHVGLTWDCHTHLCWTYGTWELPKGEALGNCRDSVRLLVVRVNQPRVSHRINNAPIPRGFTPGPPTTEPPPCQGTATCGGANGAGLVPGSYLLAALRLKTWRLTVWPPLRLLLGTVRRSSPATGPYYSALEFLRDQCLQIQCMIFHLHFSLTPAGIANA